MTDTIIQIHPEDVKSVKWTGDYQTYDIALHALSRGKYNRFLIVNPVIEEINKEDSPIHYIDEDIPETTKCIFWTYENNWLAKVFTKDWTPADGYLIVPITKPKSGWRRNMAISSLIKFKGDPTLSFKTVASDSTYLLTWYLDPKFNTSKDKVWAFKQHPLDRRTTGVKDMGYVTPIFPEHLDVLFISYNEPNAETNWQRVLEKAPWAKRVDGVEGIFNAHKAAAELSKTDMFYVVDGDAWLVDDWTFDFQPGIFDRLFTHIWRAQNPINGLVYGYGGVKLFSKQVVESAKSWATLDMSTTITPNIKIIDTVSNITAFNSDEYSTWRSAFRECAKLCYNIQTDEFDAISRNRLDAWKNIGDEHKFGNYSKAGAAAAIKWSQECNYDIEQLKSINSRDWLKEQFNKNDNRN